MDPEPLGKLVSSPDGLFLERYYDRRDAIGFSLDMGLGPAVIRAEYAYQPDRVFNTRQSNLLDTTDLDQHRAAIGVDLEGPYGLFANIQYLVDHVSDAPVYLVRPAQDRLATFFLRKTFLYDTLTVEGRWYQSYTDDDHLASFSIDYAVSENLTLKLDYQAFNGTSDGLFGQFDNKDRLTIGFRHTF